MPRERNEITGGETDTHAKPDNDRRRKKRLQVYLNDDGTPDWEATPADVRSQLGMGGAGGDGVQPAGPEIPPEMVGMLVGLIGNIEAAIVAPKMGIPSEAAREALAMPEPIAVGINEAGGRVLAKYSGSLGRYADEIVLGSLLVTWQASAFARMREYKASMPAPDVPTQTTKE
jgi:hypothetical protein